MKTKPDRRVQRTRELLQKALLELIEERGYDAITTQDIVERANVGRSTFYLHFNTKDHLFMSCHEAVVQQFHFGPLHPYPLSREQLLSPDASPQMVSAYRHLKDAWGRLHAIFESKDGSLILKRLRAESAEEIERNVRAAFAGTASTIPLDVLANYLAGAQLALLHWWLETSRLQQPQPHTPETIAQTFHRLQRAAIHDAFGIKDGE